MTEEQKIFIDQNYPTKGVKYCSDQIGISRSTISSYVRRKKLKLDKDSLYKIMSKNTINIVDYINVLDPKMAYIYGLLWSDGCVSFANNRSKTPIIKHTCIIGDAGCISDVFASYDWRRFESFTDKSLGKSKMVAHWISSRDLGNYLIENNFRNKELGTYIYRNFDEIKSHFLRGFFDGDGCFTISRSGEKYKQSAIYFSSNVNQDWAFLCEILDEINVSYKIRKIVDRLGESSQLYINGSLSIYNICEFMYKNSEGIRLERKYHKYKEFLEYKKLFKRNNAINELIP